MKRLLIELSDDEYESVFNRASYIEHIDAIRGKLQSGVNIDKKEVKMYLVSAFGFIKSYEPVLVFFDLEKAQEYVNEAESYKNGRDYKIDEINTGDYKIDMPEFHRYAVRFTESAIVVEEEDLPEEFDKNWIGIIGTKDMIKIGLYDKDKPSAIKNAKSILKGMNEKLLSTDE